MSKELIHSFFRRYFIFGEYKDGCVNISDGERDVVTHIDRDEAEVVIKDRELLLEVIDALSSDSQTTRSIIKNALIYFENFYCKNEDELIS